MEQDADKLRRQRLANHFLWGGIATGIGSFALFVPAFQNIGSHGYGIAALLLAACSVYCNNRRREIEREIRQHAR